MGGAHTYAQKNFFDVNYKLTDSGSSETLTSVKPEENYTKRHPNQIYQSP